MLRAIYELDALGRRIKSTAKSERKEKLWERKAAKKKSANQTGTQTP
jgi:hypothetical protein